MRGRAFEAEERAGWARLDPASVGFEAPTAWKGRRGRVDILVDDDSGLVAIVEVKATNWDLIKPSRVRETALRHYRQRWRYIDDYVETRQVSPGIVYPFAPRATERRSAVKEALDERFVQCVWRKTLCEAPPNVSLHQTGEQG